MNNQLYHEGNHLTLIHFCYILLVILLLLVYMHHKLKASPADVIDKQYTFSFESYCVLFIQDFISTPVKKNS